MKLLTISHTPHYSFKKTVVGWGSTVREIDHLAELFDEVIHLAPLHQEKSSLNDIPYTSGNVRLLPVQPAGGSRLKDKIQIILRSPSWIRTIRRASKEVDAIHVRCPAGISLIALWSILSTVRHKPVWVKICRGLESKGKAPLTLRNSKTHTSENLVGRHCNSERPMASSA